MADIVTSLPATTSVPSGINEEGEDDGLGLEDGEPLGLALGDIDDQ